MSVSHKILMFSTGAAMVLASLMPGGFRLDAWLFGVVLGIAQSLVGLRCYRLALCRPHLAFGHALGSGFARIAVLLLALTLVVVRDFPALPFVWSLLITYAVMMVAEIALVAKHMRQHAVEVR
jgi:hypothetical protein